MSATFRFLLLLLPFLGISQTIESDIITDLYKDQDTLDIEIKYEEYIGCIEHNYGKITIKKTGTMVHYSHISSKYKTTYFKAIDTGIIDIINNFEILAKTRTIACSGIQGDSGASIALTMNTHKSKFFYCRKDQEGIRIFISQLEAL